MSVGVEHENAEDVEDRLQMWLEEEGFSVEKLADRNTSFNLWVTKSGLPSFSVYQPRGKPDIVYVESGVTFSGCEKEIFSVVAGHNNISLLKSLLYSKGFASFKIEPPDLQFGKPGGIIFAKTIYYDGLSKDRLLETTCQILCTVKVVVLTLQRRAIQDRKTTSLAEGAWNK